MTLKKCTSYTEKVLYLLKGKETKGMKCCRCKKTQKRNQFFDSQSVIPFASCKTCRKNTPDPRKELRKKYPKITEWNLPNGWWACHINFNESSKRDNKGNYLEAHTTN